MKDCLSTMCSPFDADGKSTSLVELHNGMLSAMKELLVMVSRWLSSVYRVTIYGVLCSHMFSALF